MGFISFDNKKVAVFDAKNLSQFLSHLKSYKLCMANIVYLHWN